jgi:hypothetical protein
MLVVVFVVGVWVGFLPDVLDAIAAVQIMLLDPISLSVLMSRVALVFHPPHYRTLWISS